MEALPALGSGQIGDEGFALATLTHAKLGEPTFGIAPADGELRVTLRSMTNARMEQPNDGRAGAGVQGAGRL